MTYTPTGDSEEYNEAENLEAKHQENGRFGE